MARGFYLLIFLSLSAFARNSDIVSHENQLKFGVHCNDVTIQDVQKAGYACEPLSIRQKFQTNPSLIFEKLVFSQAANLQVLKNKCMMEKLQTITEDGEWRNTWTKIVIQKWLAAKRAETLLNYCRTRYSDQLAHLDENPSPEATFDQLMLKEIKTWPAHEAQIRQRAAHWKKTCVDDEQMQTLVKAKAIQLDTLPGVSSENFFKVLDQSRDLIINKKTGKPLSDNDILDGDLTDLSFLNFSKAQPIWDRLNQANLDILNQKKQMNARIREAQKNGEIEQDIKDEIYADNTVLDLFSDKQILKDGQPNNAVMCLLARYEPNLRADLSEMFGKAFLGGKSIQSVVKVFQFLKALGALQEAKELAVTSKLHAALNKVERISPYLALGAGSGSRIVDRCLSNAGSARKAPKSIKSEEASRVAGSKILTRNKAVDFEEWDIPFTEKQTPSCFAADIHNQLVKDSERRHCLVSEISLVVPLTIGIPLIEIDDVVD